jgi:hypothetical protein
VPLRRASLLGLACAAIAAGCGLGACALGFDRFDPGSAADASSGDARSDAKAALDAGDAGCTGAVDCVAEAGACGAACGRVSQQCQSQCGGGQCRNGCIKAEQSCRAGCASTCATCAMAEGCGGPVGCPDAAGAM